MNRTLRHFAITAAALGLGTTLLTAAQPAKADTLGSFFGSVVGNVAGSLINGAVNNPPQPPQQPLFLTPNQPQFGNPNFTNNYFGTWRGSFRQTQGTFSCSPQGALQFSVNQFYKLQGFYNPGGGIISGDVYNNGQFYATTDDGTEIEGTIRNGFVSGSYRNFNYGCSGVIQAQR